MVATRAVPVVAAAHRVVASIVAVLLLAFAMVAIGQQSADAKTASGKTAASTQLVPVPKITGVPALLWIPANKTLTLQCLATGEKVNGAVASADPYYYRVSYGGQLGYVSDADLRTSKSATRLGLSKCKTTLPKEPTSPTAGSVTSSSVTLSWRDKSNNEAAFKTQYSTNGGKSWKAGPSVAANATSIKISGLAAQKKYTFQVGASNSAGTKWSAYVTATTKAAPVVKTAGSGTCDYVKDGGNYVKKAGKGTLLGGSAYTLAGWKIAVCGPRPDFDNASVGIAGKGVNPFGGTPSTVDLDGYQCTELAARWLYHVYGAKYANADGSYAGGDGKSVVNNYAAKFPNLFVKYTDAKANRPVAGDVISFNTGTSTGHVGIVYSVDIKSDGSGSVTVLEQNSARTGGASGKSVYSVSNWKIEQAVNWLHKK